jgi:serine/threonine protein phosphatase PrpC
MTAGPGGPPTVDGDGDGDGATTVSPVPPPPVPPPAVPCARCGTPPVAGDRFCEVCGADLRVQGGDPTTANSAPCRGCGNPPPPDDDAWCPSCGLHRPDAADHVEIGVDGGAAISDRGHVRPRNEDAVALGRVGPGPADEPGRVAAVVCDGVSSTRSSELAARAAADAALVVLLRGPGGRPFRPSRLANGDVAPEATPVEEASGEWGVRSAVTAAAASAAALVPRGTPAPPSCTLVCAVHEVPAGRLTVGWVGDSRAYWLAAPGAAEPARLLSADHTAEAAAAAGALDPAVAAIRPDAITRWLGADGDAEPGVVALTPGGPGALLLCTDGLWKYLPDAAALAAVALPVLSLGGAPAAAAALTAAALTAGGGDNVTVAVLPVTLPKEEP